MRRRRTDPVEHVPAELLSFDAARWRLLVSAEPPPGTADVELWLDLAAYGVWREARLRWQAVHGLPTDPVDWLRETVRARRALYASRGEERR